MQNHVLLNLLRCAIVSVYVIMPNLVLQCFEMEYMIYIFQVCLFLSSVVSNAYTVSK